MHAVRRQTEIVGDDDLRAAGVKLDGGRTLGVSEVILSATQQPE